MGGVGLEAVGEPRLEALCKVADGLSEGAGDGAEDVGNQEVGNALVEDVIAGAQVVEDGLAGGEQNQLLLRELPVLLVLSLGLPAQRVRGLDRYTCDRIL